MATLRIPIDAIPQARPRVTKFGHSYDPPKCKRFKENFATLVKALKRDEFFTGNLAVALKIYRNFSKPTHNNFGDVDNLAKGILDACNGILWTDDRFIVDLHVQKFVTDVKPFVILEVTAMG